MSFKFDELELTQLKHAIEILIDKQDFNQQWRNSLCLPHTLLKTPFDCYITFTVEWRLPQPQSERKTS